MLSLLDSLAVSFDLPILEWIQANLQSGFMDFIMPIITVFGDAGIFWMVCAALLAIFPKTRRMGLGMGIAMAIGLVVCNMTLKPLVGRIRPYDFIEKVLHQDLSQYIEGGKLLIHEHSDFSFPSGHTIASFEAAVVMLKNSKKMGIPAMILAVLISFSRLYLYVHYPTDVIASVILGTIFALIGDAVAKPIAPKLGAGKKGKYEA